VKTQQLINYVLSGQSKFVLMFLMWICIHISSSTAQNLFYFIFVPYKYVIYEYMWCKKYY